MKELINISGMILGSLAIGVGLAIPAIALMQDGLRKQLLVSILIVAICGIPYASGHLLYLY
jgi:hypothetical protein